MSIFKKTERLTGKAWEAIHGHRGSKQWAAPRIVARSDKANRADQGNTTLANEYMDDQDVLGEKIKVFAQLVRDSKFCVAYTGAGLSKSSGIPDYATKAENSVVKGPKIGSSLDARPTYAHRVLVAMERAGLLKGYVQQNHDGLPQKAGFPQEKINEIHGAWYDPSNPVVQFSGSLRGDLFQWMLQMEKQTDLCLCLGTSLSGMNADRMANTPAAKSLKGKALGTVIVNLQLTPLDEESSLRIWAKLDDVFRMLAAELRLAVAPGEYEGEDANVPGDGDDDVFVLPYDANGVKVEDATEGIVWDLREGQKIKICVPGASNEGAEGIIRGKREEDGQYQVALWEKGGKQLVHRLLGKWWVGAAKRGAVDRLPLINLDPKFRPLAAQPVATAAAGAAAAPLVPESLRIIQGHHEVPTAEEVRHKWSLRLQEGAGAFVQSVTYTLHHTFREPIRRYDEAPFRLECTGWGTFAVGVKILLKDGRAVEGEHHLTFQGEGDAVAVTTVCL